MLSLETERFAMEILHRVMYVVCNWNAYTGICLARGMVNSRAYVIDFVWRSGYAKSTCMFLFLPLHAFIYMDLRCITI